MLTYMSINMGLVERYATFDRETSDEVNIMQHIFDQTKATLKRLPLDYIDLLQCTFYPVLMSAV